MRLVSGTEAARQLGVHPSQITRGVQSGLIKIHAPDGLGRVLIDVDQARAAREQGLDRSKLRGPRAPLFAVEQSEIAVVPPSVAAPPPVAAQSLPVVAPSLPVVATPAVTGG